MPIDSSILNALANPTPLKINFPDPVQQYNALLQVADVTGRLRKMRQDEDDEEASANALRNAIRPDGSIDRSLLLGDLGKSGRTKAYMGATKQFADLDQAAEVLNETRSKTRENEVQTVKTGAEAAKIAAENSRFRVGGMSSDINLGPKQYADNLALEMQDPALLQAFGNNPQAVQMAYKMKLAKLQAAVKAGQWVQFRDAEALGPEKALERHYEAQDLGGHKNVLQMPKYGTGQAGVVPGSDQTVTKDPNSRGTNITINNAGPNEYAKKMGELTAQRDFELGESAGAAESRLAEFGRMRELLKKGNAFTGTGAELKMKALSVAKALGQNVNEDALTESQELQMFLSTNSLENIAALRELGVKLGSVTEKEFDQLMKSAPKVTDDAMTIDRWLERAENATRRVRDKYNQRNQRVSDNPATRPVTEGLSIDKVPVSSSGGVTPKAKTSGPGFEHNVILLRAGKVTKEDFDDKYGDGAAAHVLGGTPTGANPKGQGAR